jgi:hypothetical protein
MIQKLTPKKVEDLYKQHYRFINNNCAGTTFNIDIVDDIDVCCKSDIKIITHPTKVINFWYGSRRVQYRDAKVNIKISKQHDLPLIVDDMMNLYSKFKRKIYKTSIYEASWIVHTNSGASVNYHNGYIARLKIKNDYLYYHADSVKDAFKGVSEKVKKHNEFYKKHGKFIDSIPEKLNISFKDSIEAGNCESGTMNFINRNKLNKSKSYNARYIYNLAPLNNDVKRVIHYAMSKT